MAEEDAFYQSDIEVSQIISHKLKDFRKKRGIKTSPILKRENVKNSSKMLLVGGDSDDISEVQPPSIIVEKGASGQISRIIVKCSCGQSAELVCEYE